MRNLCLVFAFTSSLALAAGPASSKVGAKTVPDSTAKGADPAAVAPAVPAQPAVAPSGAAAPALAAPVPAQAPVASPDTAAATATAAPADSGAAPDSGAAAKAAPEAPSRPAVAVLPPPPPDQRLFPDASLVAREYLFGVVGQTVAGALGFFIGSAIETAIAGEEEAHKGTLSFKGIRYDNFYGAFWGGTVGGLMGSSLTVYFTGQSDEEDGGFLWTLTGTALAGAGALYAAHLMGVNDDVDWKPFLPLLAIPTLGGVAGFNVSRWFSDRKRESIMGPDAGLTLYPPRLAWGRTAEGDRFHLQALNLGF